MIKHKELTAVLVLWLFIIRQVFGFIQWNTLLPTLIIMYTIIALNRQVKIKYFIYDLCITLCGVFVYYLFRITEFNSVNIWLIITFAAFVLLYKTMSSKINPLDTRIF